jgi:hypothetical protein
MYSTGFQCPDTGEWVVAKYAFGKLIVTFADDATMPETKEYCKRHTNKRFKSLDEANDYIIRASQGQTFGLEKY